MIVIASEFFSTLSGEILDYLQSIPRQSKNGCLLVYLFVSPFVC